MLQGCAGGSVNSSGRDLQVMTRAVIACRAGCSFSQSSMCCVDALDWPLLAALSRLFWSKVLKCVQGRTQFLQKRECCAGALEGRFIATLARLNNAKTVLEVGMFTGTTTLAVAQALPDDGKVK